MESLLDAFQHLRARLRLAPQPTTGLDAHAPGSKLQGARYEELLISGSTAVVFGNAGANLYSAACGLAAEGFLRQRDLAFTALVEPQAQALPPRDDSCQAS